jgi:hypothetical protein
VNSITAARRRICEDGLTQTEPEKTMSPSLNTQSASRRRSAAAGNFELAAESAGFNFDMREALSATVVRELSFAEFRAALELVGKKHS